MDQDPLSNVVATPWPPTGTPGRFVFETENVTEAERRAYRAMERCGLSGTVRAVDGNARLAKRSSPDLLMLGSRWELKCPDGSNRKRTVPRNLAKAKSQLIGAVPPASRIRIVLSALEIGLTREEVDHSVRKWVGSKPDDEVLVIYKGGDLVLYRKTEALCAPCSGAGVPPLPA